MQMPLLLLGKLSEISNFEYGEGDAIVTQLSNLIGVISRTDRLKLARSLIQ
jgi:hypothetical protein